MEIRDFDTIFLDRDGVINIERPNDYVKKPDEFIFIDGACEAIAQLSGQFRHILIVTNQRGIGRGKMTLSDLEDVHRYMLNEIEKHGGRIDKIYFCTDLTSDSINRKPNTGMAFQAQSDFPDIVFNRSIMVGNSRSDMEFANKLGIYSVLVGDKYNKEDKIYQTVKAYYPSLYNFVEDLLQK
ncbi:HAD-IIIA family hydrolase [Dysgonomonas sp. 25]|uniref:D-glycero-alpha-D-manno-heptose-1,7-bisphosphate 7-phosphatase n=1 Tax=Dysgonomonas sp. 25 TaxID=2302933 RepID=UPI0013CFFEF7|nr:HAD-IIIA family hydrolase [Dysgonomonas sp. 25]NDV67853.1 HAD-IIIA family hydrolase [Dysgonomonas sp. 25]